MLDDPIVPAELYTAVFIYASLWSMFPIFLPGLFPSLPLPLFVTVGVQLRCIQDTLIRVDYRGRKGGEEGREQLDTSVLFQLSILRSRIFSREKKCSTRAFYLLCCVTLLHSTRNVVVVVVVLLTQLNEEGRGEVKKRAVNYHRSSSQAFRKRD